MGSSNERGRTRSVQMLDVRHRTKSGRKRTTKRSLSVPSVSQIRVDPTREAWGSGASLRILETRGWVPFVIASLENSPSIPEEPSGATPTAGNAMRPPLGTRAADSNAKGEPSKRKSSQPSLMPQTEPSYAASPSARAGITMSGIGVKPQLRDSSSRKGDVSAVVVQKEGATNTQPFVYNAEASFPSLDTLATQPPTRKPPPIPTSISQPRSSEPSRKPPPGVEPARSSLSEAPKPPLASQLSERVIERHAVALQNATQRGDITSTHQQAALLISAANHFVAVAKQAARDTDDERYRAELNSRIRDVEQDIPRLQDGAWSTSDGLESGLELFSIVNLLTSKLTRLGTFIRPPHKLEGAKSGYSSPAPPRYQSVPDVVNVNSAALHQNMSGLKPARMQSSHTSLGDDGNSPYVSALDIAAGSYEELPPQPHVQYRSADVDKPPKQSKEGAPKEIPPPVTVEHSGLAGSDIKKTPSNADSPGSTLLRAHGPIASVQRTPSFTDRGGISSSAIDKINPSSIGKVTLPIPSSEPSTGTPRPFGSGIIQRSQKEVGGSSIEPSSIGKVQLPLQPTPGNNMGVGMAPSLNVAGPASSFVDPYAAMSIGKVNAPPVNAGPVYHVNWSPQVGLQSVIQVADSSGKEAPLPHCMRFSTLEAKHQWKLTSTSPN
ncbi:hypothetical protein DFJ77DRAFT_530607 [Powellomyces hirtus]|nr:hypothetical protein DFJ77DRAFT_530607 [Powellomyces hirtus]